MTNYDFAQICERGDIIANRKEYFVSDKYCTKCGSIILNACPECKAPFHGSDIELGFVMEYQLPMYCYSCGKPYPWTKTAIESTIELIKMEQNIDESEKEELIKCLPDVIHESPKTTVAMAKLQIFASKSVKFIADGIRQFAIDFGCELAKKMMGLN